MERYMITQSLLSSWGYVFNCYEDGQEAAQADFLRALNRIPLEQTDAMANGIEFEREVYKAAAGLMRPPHPKWEPGIKAVATIIRGAPVQVKVQRDIEVCGMRFLVYGILDALKAGTIYDVKFLNKSFGSAELAGKYLDSPQHPAYLYAVPEALRFEYLVSDGNDLYCEPYDRKHTRNIGDIISEFVDYLHAGNLLDLYKEKWLAL